MSSLQKWPVLGAVSHSSQNTGENCHFTGNRSTGITGAKQTQSCKTPKIYWTYHRVSKVTYVT